ncbi:MAG: ribulose-phosphate 3-epimerase [Evtepia gabavorous]
MERRGVRKGIALRPITAAEAVLPYLDKVDLILVMTVEPGFGGQAFMADQLPKIAAIRRYIQERNPTCRLEVDGGVDPVTARQVVEAGADVLVAGSAIYGAPDPAQAIRALRGGNPGPQTLARGPAVSPRKEGRGSFMEYFPRIGKNGGTVCPPARHWP